MDGPEERVGKLFEKQAGCVTRQQALACGMTVGAITARLRSGRWRRASAGAYRLSGVGAVSEAVLFAASLKLPGAVVSHESAARRLGFPLIPDGPSVVTVPASTTHVWAGLRVVESSDLSDSDCISQGILTVTAPVRTMVDLATTLRPGRLARVLDEALASRLVSLDELAARHAQLSRKGKPGTTVMRELLEHRGIGYVPPESELEARFLGLLARHSFPLPDRQVQLPWMVGTNERVDFAYPEERLIIECDGRRWHTRERDFERDRRRDNDAMLAGWRVLRITWDQLVADELGVVSTLRRALERPAA